MDTYMQLTIKEIQISISDFGGK